MLRPAPTPTQARGRRRAAAKLTLREAMQRARSGYVPQHRAGGLSAPVPVADPTTVPIPVTDRLAALLRGTPVGAR